MAGDGFRRTHVGQPLSAVAQCRTLWESTVPDAELLALAFTIVNHDAILSGEEEEYFALSAHGPPPPLEAVAPSALPTLSPKRSLLFALRPAMPPTPTSPRPQDSPRFSTPLIPKAPPIPPPQRNPRPSGPMKASPPPGVPPPLASTKLLRHRCLPPLPAIQPSSSPELSTRSPQAPWQARTHRPLAARHCSPLHPSSGLSSPRPSAP
jgi:hypothetical protein